MKEESGYRHELALVAGCAVCCVLLGIALLWPVHSGINCFACICGILFFSAMLAIRLFQHPGECRLRRRVLLVLFDAALVLCAYSIWTQRVLAADVGLRILTQHTVGIDELQQWAERMVATVSNDGVISDLPTSGDVTSQKIVALVGGPAYRWRISIVPSMGNERCVCIRLGGGFWDQGIYVGSRGFRLAPRDRLFRWRDGVYGFQ